MSMIHLIMLPMGEGLDGMRKRMSQIQLATLPCLVLVARHHSGLHLSSSRNQRSHLRKPSGKHLRPVFLIIAQSRAALACLHKICRKILKQSHGPGIMTIILNNESLQHLSRPRLEILHWQTLQHLRTKIGKLRLTDSAQHILISPCINAGLATDCSIHLRQERGRNICKAHPPLIKRSCKTGHICRDTTSDSQHQSIPVGTVIEQPAAYIHHGLHTLGLLSGIHQHPGRPATIKHLRHIICSRTLHRHITVHHHEHIPVLLQTLLQCLNTISHNNPAKHLFPRIYINLIHRHLLTS